MIETIVENKAHLIEQWSCWNCTSTHRLGPEDWIHEYRWWHKILPTPFPRIFVCPTCMAINRCPPFTITQNFGAK